MMLGFIFATFLTSAPIDVIAKVGKKPLAGQLLRLVEVVQGKADGIREERTNAQGKARFEFVTRKGSTENAYVIVTFVDGEAYTTAVFNVARLPKAPLLLQAYEKSHDVSALSISSVSYAFKLSEAGQLEIEEGFTVENPTDKTISTEDPKAEILKLDLPAQVFNFRYGEGFSEDTTHVDGNQIVVSTTFRPGSHYFSMNYEIDKARYSYSFKKSFSFPIQRVEAFLNDDALELPDFNTEEVKKFYQESWGRLLYKDINGAKSFSLKLTGLPLNIPWSWWMPFILLIGLGLGLMSLNRIRSQENAGIPQNKRDLLLALRSLRQVRGKNLISPKEYENKKLMLLELLVPHYEQKHDRPTS